MSQMFAMSKRLRLVFVLGVALASPALGQGSTRRTVTEAANLTNAPPPDQRTDGITLSTLLGATVVNNDHDVVGVINDVIFDTNGHAQSVVIGLGGFLGLGEKDVAIPFTLLSFATPFELRGVRSFPNGRYTGSSPRRVLASLTIQQLSAAPAFQAKSSRTSVGVPSETSGTPEGTHKEPKSSTESGGPG